MSYYKIGDKVFILTDKYIAEEVEIVDYVNSSSASYYLVKTKYGKVGILENYIYKTKEVALATIQSKCEEKIQKYLKEELISIEDVIKFPLYHIISGPDFDKSAREAYKIKVGELLSIEVDTK